MIKITIIFLMLFVFPVSLQALTVQEHYDAAAAALEEGDYYKAVEHLQKAVDSNPGIPQLHNALGIALTKKYGTLNRSMASFDKAIQLDPHYGEPYFNIGTFHAGVTRDLVLATEYFEKAIEVDPRYARPYMGLGWLYLQREDARKAVGYFQQALDIDSNIADAHYGLGLSYAALKKTELTLEPITTLRALGRADLASAIESLLVNNSKEELEDPLAQELDAAPTV